MGVDESGRLFTQGAVATQLKIAVLSTSGWSGSAPYTQTVTVDGLTDGMRVRAYPAYGDDYQPALAMREAVVCVSYAKRDGSNVTFTCLEDKPAVDIDVVLEVYV